MNVVRFAAATLLVIAVYLNPARAFSEQEALAALVAAYPETLAKIEGRTLHWRDGTTIEIPPDERKPYDSTLRNASLIDQMRLPYSRGALESPPGPSDDAGRFRNLAFFRKMYGDCWKGEVAKQLVPVVWLSKSWGQTIHATSVNGVAQKLSAVSAEIEQLPDKIRLAAYPTAGSYTCRTIVDTGQPSMHAYGAAVDLNLAISDYWYWQRTAAGTIAYRNRVPQAIVDIFERHGFIWGGKWYHYDTMHFEYRPELLVRR